MLLVLFITNVCHGEIQLTKSEEKRSLVEVDFSNVKQRIVLAEREIVHLKEEVCAQLPSKLPTNFEATLP